MRIQWRFRYRSFFHLKKKQTKKEVFWFLKKLLFFLLPKWKRQNKIEKQLRPFLIVFLSAFFPRKNFPPVERNLSISLIICKAVLPTTFLLRQWQLNIQIRLRDVFWSDQIHQNVMFSNVCFFSKKKKEQFGPKLFPGFFIAFVQKGKPALKFQLCLR